MEHCWYVFFTPQTTWAHISFFLFWKNQGGGAVSSAIAYWFYLSHLEVEPITGRERFSIVSSKQIQELSQLEFQAVNDSSVFFLFIGKCLFIFKVLSSQICLEFVNRIIPTHHPYYARVKRVANRLLLANKHLPQIYTKTWTITVLDDPGNMNAFVLPVSYEANRFY